MGIMAGTMFPGTIVPIIIDMTSSGVIFGLMDMQWRSWIVAGTGFASPIVAAARSGTTYIFAVSIIAFGVVLYFLNIALIFNFIRKRAPEALTNGQWERTAGTGVVPTWVSEIGLIGFAFVPAGAVVALLLFLGLVDKR